uniref:Trophoblast specific protein alpha n=1 Tax=Mus musculus TaxID=10090 RepID=A0A286YCI4_MOUSE
MTPTIFLVILCLGVASAAIVPEAQLDAELQEQKDKEVLIKAVWSKFMKTNKLHSSENDQETEGSNIEMSASGQLRRKTNHSQLLMTLNLRITQRVAMGFLYQISHSNMDSSMKLGNERNSHCAIV